MTCIVCDMQPGFNVGKYGGLIKSCHNEVKRAVSQNEAVIFLEYEKHGPTVYPLGLAVTNYPFFSKVTKNSDDGGIECIDEIYNRKYSKDRIRVCGVFADLCIKSTLETMEKFLPKKTKFEVVKTACVSRQPDGFDWVCGKFKLVEENHYD